MVNRSIPAALAALCCWWAAAALAQPNDSPNMVPGNEAYYIEHPWERYGGPYDSRWYRQRADDYRQRGLRGAGPERDLRIGQRVPRELVHRQHMIVNWDAHRLFRPPHGYQWFQAGSDYLLVEQATGLIALTRLAR